MSEQHKIRVGISQGDINGIGIEVILKAFADPMMSEICTPILFSSPKTVTAHRKLLGMDDFQYNTIRETDQAHPKRFNVLGVYENEVNVEPGKATAEGGKYALLSLEAAVKALQENKIDVLVTAPINKHTIQSEEFSFPGHTEYLQQRFGAQQSLMLLLSDNLRVGLVTGHVPIREVAQHITVDRICEKVRTMSKTLIEDFGIRRPRIAVLGLNPHAGDNGTLGKEEIEIIQPAIEKLKQENFLVFGPYAADGFFGSGAYRNFDAVLAMHHDQGLAPFKALAFGGGVNFTAGLPFVRTSPDHGTGFDIAGQNKADESSFRQAVFAAIDIFRTRHQWGEISANPLKSQPLKQKDRDR